MSLTRGDVVLLAFPFSDLSGVKVRPALVLSSSEYNSKDEDVIVCLISSNLARKGFFLYQVDKSHPDFQVSGLKVPSVLIIDKIHTLHNSLIKRRLGTIRSAAIQEIQRILQDLILN